MDEKNKETCRSLLEEAVATGRRQFDQDYLKENEGHFWGILETRPYMRSLSFLAQDYWVTGKREEAVMLEKEMLRLNPNDNQGIRYQYCSHLICLDRDDEAWKILQEYREDSTFFLYDGALLLYRKKGPTVEANKALRKALRENLHVPAYLLHVRKLPRKLPQGYSPGSCEEAVVYLVNAIEVWLKKQDTLLWLAQNLKTLAEKEMT